MTNPTTILTLLLLTITTLRATSARHLQFRAPPSDSPLAATALTTTAPARGAPPTAPITATLSPPPATDIPAPLLTFFIHDVLLIGPNQSTTTSTTTKDRLFAGAMTVINDELTGSAEIGSGTVVGKAQGFCVGSAEEGTSKTVAFTAMFEEGGDYKDSLSFFGVQRMVGAEEEESRVAVMGGTGKYVGVKGYATVRAVVTGGGEEHVTDGVGTLLQFFVYLA